MSIFTSLEAKLATSESWVLQVIANIQKAEQVVQSDIQIATAWVESHITEINGDLQEIEKAVGYISQAGVALPPAVTEAISAANVAVAGLNAYAASAQAGASTPQSLVDGYVAAKNVAVATAAAGVALATTPVANPVITPTVATS